MYWTVSFGVGLPAVTRVPIAGGTATPLAPGGDFLSQFVAVDDERVYWIQHDRYYGLDHEPVDVRASLLSMPVAGGPAVELASRSTWPRAFAFDGTHLYWGTASTVITTGRDTGNWADWTDGEILATTRDGVTSVITGGIDNPGGIASNGADVCWTRNTGANWGRPGSVACVRSCDCAK